MKVYIAGPMRGIPQFNFPAFFAAERQLLARGYEVFNPAREDIVAHGKDISFGNDTGCERQAAQEHGFNLRVALSRDLQFICLADIIALLPGWEHSKGAKAELAVARALGLEEIHL